MTNSKDSTARALAWPTNVQDQQIGSRLLLSSRLQYQRRDRVGLRYEGKVTRLDADGSDLRVIETPAHRPTPSMSVLLERGGQVFFVVGVDDNDREQLCRRGRACIAADAMDGARRLVPTFARAVDPLRFVIHL